jgi:hypothetical protein
MKRAEWLETRKMRFEEAHRGWQGGRLTQEEAARLLVVLHAKLPQGVIVCVLFGTVILHFGLELNRAMCGAIAQRLHAQQLVTQLEQGQQRLLEAQHQQSVLLERQRVMQDMHDGLVSALSIADFARMRRNDDTASGCCDARVR